MVRCQYHCVTDCGDPNVHHFIAHRQGNVHALAGPCSHHNQEREEGKGDHDKRNPTRKL